jgi:protein-disulfide isomerase
MLSASSRTVQTIETRDRSMCDNDSVSLFKCLLERGFMFNQPISRIWALLALMFLAACGNQPAAPAPTVAAPPAPTTAAPPTRAPTGLATAAVAPAAAGTQVPTVAHTGAASPEASAAAIPDSLTPEGYHMLGRTDAPVTLVMYSDFL